MPSRWDLALPGLEPAGVRLEHLHAVVSTWFDRDDEAHRASAKPYTVSPPRAGPGGPVVEIGLLDDGLANRLLTVASPGARVRLGRTTISLSEHPRQTAAIPWDRMVDATSARAWCVRFATPTTFRRGNSFSPLPTPKTVLGSLRHSWRAFAPPEVLGIELDLTADPAWVTDIDGRNEVSKVNGRTVSGFVGRLRIECDGTDATAAMIDRLMRLAPFSGVGAYTTRGFGVTRLESTWAPHRR